MPRTLTYPTRSQAEQTAGDYINQGYVAKVTRSGEHEYKVVLSEGLREPTAEDLSNTGTVLTPEEEEEQEIEKRVREKRIAQKVERRTTPKRAQVIRDELRKAEERLAVKKELEKSSEEVEKSGLERRKKELEDLNKLNESRGRKTGIITPVYDERTNRITDYYLDTKAKRRAESEKMVRGYIEKSGGRGIEDISKLPGGIARTTEGTIESSSGNMSIKGGFRRSIQGGSIGQPGGISNMSRPKIGTVGAIGTEKPSIGRVSKPDLNKIQVATTGTVKATPSLTVAQKDISNVKKKEMPWGIPYMKDNPNSE